MNIPEYLGASLVTQYERGIAISDDTEAIVQLFTSICTTVEVALPSCPSILDPRYL